VRSGLGLQGSFRYVGERDSSEFEDLRGLDDVDDALELGVGLAYRQDAYQVFGDLRYGVTGHDSFVGEVGADVFFRPTDRLTLNAGPRVFFAEDSYAQEYFGVSAAEAARSALPAFEADGGALGAGLEIGAEYRLNDSWGIEGAVTYDRLLGDAEDSPITEAGSADQYGVRVGLTRRITFGF
jgi:outer membrane scaffolding protein for murein synthesis (MipA/OmpV family)